MSVSQTLKLYQSTQDIAANTSKLRVLWTSTQSGESHNLNTRTAKYWVSVNGGPEQQYSVSYTLPKGKTQTIVDATFVVPHDDQGKCTVKVRTWMDTRISAGVVQKSASITMTTIPRANTISAADTVIGQSMKITVVRKSSSYLHDILYSFGSLSGKIVEKSAATEVNFTIPASWDAQMTNAKNAPVTLTAVTYLGDKEVGRSATTAQIKTDASFAPKVTAKVEDINPDTVALTGDASKLIRGVSTARATMTATAQRGASIKSTKINSVSTTALEVEGVQSGTFSFSAVDSRGWETVQAVNLSVIPYTPPTALIEIQRGAQGNDALTITIKGNYFNGDFSAGNANTLAVRYRVGDGAWTSVTPTIDGNTYTARISLSLDYQASHTLHFRIADRLTILGPVRTIPKAVPIMMEGEDWVRFNVPVHQVCPWYYSDTDNDESAFDAWLDDLLDSMPNLSSMSIAWKCSPAIGEAAAYGTLSRHTSAGYAVVHGASYDGRIYIKTKYQSWNATKRVVLA